MILTGVPYQHKYTKRVYVADDVTAESVHIRTLGNGGITFEIAKPTFLQNFERVREAPPPKGWDEEL